MAALSPAQAGLAPAHGDWSCTNADLEIGCDGESCTVAGDHTPMSIESRSGHLGVCAYSGCWEGAPDAVMTAGRFTVVTALALPFSTAPDDTADIALTIDTQTGVATLQVAGQYAQPVLCTAEGR